MISLGLLKRTAAVPRPSMDLAIPRSMVRRNRPFVDLQEQEAKAGALRRLKRERLSRLSKTRDTAEPAQSAEKLLGKLRQMAQMREEALQNGSDEE